VGTPNSRKDITLKKQHTFETAMKWLVTCRADIHVTVAVKGESLHMCGTTGPCDGRTNQNDKALSYKNEFKNIKGTQMTVFQCVPKPSAKNCP
jgi:hypothetical protein